MELRPYQEQARTLIQQQWEQGVKKTLLVLPTGCHALGSELLCYSGDIKKVEELNINDLLMGMDGTPRRILHKQQGVRNLYKIIPIKGKPFIVTDNHLLTLVRVNEKSRKKYPSDFLGNTLIDVSVKEYLKWSKNKKHIHKLIRSEKIENFKAQNLDCEIEAYFLGILLGDGSLKNSLSITTMDKEVVEEINKQCLKYKMTYETIPAGKANTYVFKTNSIGKNGSLLHNQLKNLGLRNKDSHTKFIPQIYKTNTTDVRLNLLAGLLDSDGYYNIQGSYEYVTASKQLAEDVCFIARSLGLAAYESKTIKKIKSINFEGEYFRVSISGNLDIIPCKIERKKATPRKQKKNVLRTGFTIEYVGKGEYIGFTVDKDNRYLMSDFTITHNCGKTIVFSKIIEDRVRMGERVLVLAHRGELLEQASDKLEKSTGLKTALEKAESTSLNSWFRVVVGSIQTLQRDKRLKSFRPNHFDTIIIDEAHHAISNSYQVVLQYFNQANVLGVTATPDRGDKKNLGQYFDSLAFEYGLPQAIKEGYLSPIKAMTIPIELDLSSVAMQSGDYKASDVGNVLDPYLEKIADEMKTYCKDRKTVIFLPLVSTSKKFAEILNNKGFKACEVNGESEDRKEVLEAFDKDEYNVLCNSMLLTEGWDCPSVDCVIVLRPTKSRALYSQMVGRGTRLYPGKSELLLLDFLWHIERHELCRPASLIASDPDVAKKMTEKIENTQYMLDIQEVEKEAKEEVLNEREEALAQVLAEQRKKKRTLVDPLQYEMSIQDSDLANYVPNFGWEMLPPSEKQLQALEKFGIFSESIENAGKASLFLDRLNKRKEAGLSTPKQIRLLERYEFKHVGEWTFEQARKMINRIAAFGWRLPYGVVPQTYKPE